MCKIRDEASIPDTQKSFILSNKFIYISSKTKQVKS